MVVPYKIVVRRIGSVNVGATVHAETPTTYISDVISEPKEAWTTNSGDFTVSECIIS